ncbi:D-amino-acid transaminase [Ensifer soli]|uniref:D-amino-acid transaminase n=1 Tax=Ciceribacter sp. sgz301302 TaxID=3342379 RepID=UPI0035B7DB28
MSSTERIVYVNGDYCAESQARISIFDRGNLFADAVYEVTCVLDGRLVDFDGHMARLQRSFEALSMTPAGVDRETLLSIHRQLVDRNGLKEGLIYLQVSRGVADRDFAFPPAATPPGILLFTQEKVVIDSPLARRGLSVISLPDIRWGRRDIKTVQLLYPSLAKQEAVKAGADDAFLVEDGVVTEASSANAWIVTGDRTLVTRPLSNAILHGITRKAVLHFVGEAGYRLEERAFTLDEAKAAAEAFITSATSFVTAVTRIDGTPVGDGTIGPVAGRLREIYIGRARGAAI